MRARSNSMGRRGSPNQKSTKINEKTKIALIDRLLKAGVSQELIDQVQNDDQLKAIRIYVDITGQTDLDFNDISYIYNKFGVIRYRHSLIRQKTKDFLKAKGVDEEILNKLPNPFSLKALAHVITQDPDADIDINALKAVRTKKKLKKFILENTDRDYAGMLRDLGAKEEDVEHLDGATKFVQKAFLMFATYKRGQSPDFAKLEEIDNETVLEAFEVAKRCNIDFERTKSLVQGNNINYTKLKESLFGITKNQIDKLIEDNPDIAQKLKSLFTYFYHDFSDATSISLVTEISNIESIAHYISQKVASDIGLESEDFTKGKFIAQIVKIIAERDGIDPENLTEPEDAMLKDLLNGNSIDTSSVTSITDITDKVTMSEVEIRSFMNPAFEKQILDELDDTPTSTEFYEAIKKQIFIEIPVIDDLIPE